MSKGGLLYKFGVSAPFDTAERFVTSPVLPPLALAAIRLIFATYGLAVALFSLIWDAVKLDQANSYFSYFTNLSYIGLLSYFWASGVQTLAYAFRRRKGYPLQKWPQVFQFLHILLFTSVVTFPILVTIAYWTLLSDSSTFATTFSTWHNISAHALNTPFALFEIFFTRAGPLPWLHLPILLVFLACYLGVAYITHATQGFYTYDFLDPQIQHAKVAAYIVGIAVGEVIVFVAVHYLIVLRERLVSKSTGTPTVIGRTSQPIDEWEELERPSMSSVVHAV